MISVVVLIRLFINERLNIFYVAMAHDAFNVSDLYSGIRIG